MNNLLYTAAIVAGLGLCLGCSSSGQKKLGKALDTAAEIATGDCGQKVAAAALACAKHIPTK